MLIKINYMLDKISEYLAHKKGLLPLIGILFVLVNGIIQFVPGDGWLVESNLFLHIGILLALVGFLLAWAL